MKIFLTGGTGFVGRELLRQILAEGHTVRCLVRPGSESKVTVARGVEIHRGDAAEPRTLAGGMAGCDAVIHLVGIIREFPGRGVTFKRLHVEAASNVVEAAESQGVPRFLHMSANGAEEGAASPYQRTKWQGEEAVRRSKLDWTIFRPSVIFGPRDEFVNLLADMIDKLPVLPVVGDGRYRLQPVAVEDVATGFVKSLVLPEAVGQTYHCCGPESYSYDELLDLIGRALGKRKVRKLHHPACLVKPAVALLQNIPAFPLTTAQLTMLLGGNVCDPGPWAKAFGIDPLPFPKGIARYLGKE